VNTQESILDKAAATATNISTTNNKQGEDIMSVLLAHEKKGGTNSSTSIKTALPQESSDSSDNEEEMEMQTVDTGMTNFLNNKSSDIRIASRSMRVM
jgi:transcription initiation factor TFIIE subunit alpha